MVKGKEIFLTWRAAVSPEHAQRQQEKT